MAIKTPALVLALVGTAAVVLLEAAQGQRVGYRYVEDGDRTGDSGWTSPDYS